jgi:hypothetical protein
MSFVASPLIAGFFMANALYQTIPTIISAIVTWYSASRARMIEPHAFDTNTLIASATGNILLEEHILC